MEAEKADPKVDAGAVKPFVRRIPLVGPAVSLYLSYSRRNGPLFSAGIAYYGLFALAPLMLVTLNISGYLVGSSKAQTELFDALDAYLGPKLADVISGVVGNLQSAGSTVTTFIGVALFLYAATRLFLRLKAAFNVMWDIETKWEQRSSKRLLARLATFGMILVPTILVLISLFLSSGISWLASIFGISGWLLRVAEALIPFLVGWGALVAIFTILPDARISWRDNWLGALCVSALWSLGARVFGTYLSWTTSQKYAGAVGALIAIIVWVDFMAIISLLGARLNRILYGWRGRTLQPYSFARTAQSNEFSTTDEANAASEASNEGEADTTSQPDGSGESNGPERG